MDFLLNNEQLAFKEVVNSFAKEKMEPYAAQWDEEKISELAKRPKLEKIYNHIDQKPSIQKIMKNQSTQ